MGVEKSGTRGKFIVILLGEWKPWCLFLA